MKYTVSERLLHFFHVVSNIRPIYWIGLYVALTPLFALVYWALPDGQFRIPDNAGTDFGSWLYYSIVTITTLGFGDYTPAHGWAQAVTAIEVMCGLIFLGLFLNAVGSMKSEIDVESEIEKQRRLHESQEKDKLIKSIPIVLHHINAFLNACYAVTTPSDKRNANGTYNPDFDIKDMADLHTNINLKGTQGVSAIHNLLKVSGRTTLCLDGLQNRIDLTLWPSILDNCFAFVANYQMYTAEDLLNSGLDTYNPSTGKNNSSNAQALPPDTPVDRSDLYYFIKENASLATKLETELAALQS